MSGNFRWGRLCSAFILTFCGVLLISGNAFGAGGACPTGANYLNVATNSLVTLASLGVTNCYFIAANGSDTNNGTSEATPWLHAPYMPNCSGNCATAQSSMTGTAFAGVGFIFRGGDTWHFGASTSPSTGGTWNFNQGGSPPSGTSSNPIYIGVDPAWYSGSSWARPVLTGDNPLCNSSLVNGSTCFQDTTNTYEQYYVSRCSYQVGSSNVFVDLDWVGYYIFDNFEMAGLCQNSTGQPWGHDIYLGYHSVHGPQTFLNDYIHGWTHTQFAASNSHCTSGQVCWNTYVFQGAGNTSSIVPDFLQYIVVDGLDSDPVGAGLGFPGAYYIAYSVFRYQSMCLPYSLHVFHDNLYEYLFENGHTDMLLTNGMWNGTDVLYNNIFRHLETSGGNGGVGVWLNPPTGTTSYFFNNLIYDEGAMEVYNIANPETNASIGFQELFNNTLEFSDSNIIGCCTGYTCQFGAANNHFITDSSGFYNAACASQITSNVTNLQMTHSTATSNGYTASETYAYSPTGGSGPTVGAGTNEGSLNAAYCTALSTAASSDPMLLDAATACLSDTRSACTYNSTSHTVTCPARTVITRPTSAKWDIGAYQSGDPPPAPQPPTNVQAAAH